MNLFTAARIMGINQKTLAKMLDRSPRTLRRRKAKVGEYVEIEPGTDTRTVDMFTGMSLYDEAAEQFDYLMQDFMHRTNRQKGLKGLAAEIFGDRK